MLDFKKDVKLAWIVEALNVDDMDFIEKLYYFNEEWNKPLTRDQLIKRGSCCALGCSQCPYSKPRILGNVNLEQ